MTIKNQFFRVKSCEVTGYGCPNKGEDDLKKSIIKEKVEADCEKDLGKGTEAKMAT